MLGTSGGSVRSHDPNHIDEKFNNSRIITKDSDSGCITSPEKDDINFIFYIVIAFVSWLDENVVDSFYRFLLRLASFPDGVMGCYYFKQKS